MKRSHRAWSTYSAARVKAHLLTVQVEHSLRNYGKFVHWASVEERKALPNNRQQYRPKHWQKIFVDDCFNSCVRIYVGPYMLIVKIYNLISLKRRLICEQHSWNKLLFTHCWINHLQKCLRAGKSATDSPRTRCKWYGYNRYNTRQTVMCSTLIVAATCHLLALGSSSTERRIASSSCGVLVLLGLHQSRILGFNVPFSL